MTVKHKGEDKGMKEKEWGEWFLEAGRCFYSGLEIEG